MSQQRIELLRIRTAAVVFDFDGTLTKSVDNSTAWEKIWVALGYPSDRCLDLHRRYQRKEFTHQQWCDMTCAAFRAKGLRLKHIRRIARDIDLVEGVAETISVLRQRGIRLYVLSGSIRSIIREVLGELWNEFEEIKANDLMFDRSGSLGRINSTPYDFEGKADYLRVVMQELRIAPASVLFVGNSSNDIFASRSGARTLCVNARFTDPHNEEHWTYAIGDMGRLNEILKFVDP